TAGGGVSGGGMVGGASVSAGGAAWVDGAPPPNIVCDTAGLRRDATPDENAQYCVCEQVSRVEGAQTSTWLLWACYGPPPSSPRPSATCTYTDVNPGVGNGSCWVNWASCSDGQVYSFSCANRICNCLVQGHRTPVQLEPRDTCPENKIDLNAFCGWNLQ